MDAFQSAPIGAGSASHHQRSMSETAPHQFAAALAASSAVTGHAAAQSSLIGAMDLSALRQGDYALQPQSGGSAPGPEGVPRSPGSTWPAASGVPPQTFAAQGHGLGQGQEQGPGPGPGPGVGQGQGALSVPPSPAQAVRQFTFPAQVAPQPEPPQHHFSVQAMSQPTASSFSQVIASQHALMQEQQQQQQQYRIHQQDQAQRQLQQQHEQQLQALLQQEPPFQAYPQTGLQHLQQSSVQGAPLQAPSSLQVHPQPMAATMMHQATVPSSGAGPAATEAAKTAAAASVAAMATSVSTPASVLGAATTRAPPFASSSPVQRRHASQPNQPRPQLQAGLVATDEGLTAHDTAPRHVQSKSANGSGTHTPQEGESLAAIGQIGVLLDQVAALALNARDLFRKGEHGGSSMCLGDLQRNLEQIGTLGSRSLARVQSEGAGARGTQDAALQAQVPAQSVQQTSHRPSDSVGSLPAYPMHRRTDTEASLTRKRCESSADESMGGGGMPLLKTLRSQDGTPIGAPSAPPSAPPMLSALHGRQNIAPTPPNSAPPHLQPQSADASMLGFEFSGQISSSLGQPPSTTAKFGSGSQEHSPLAIQGPFTYASTLPGTVATPKVVGASVQSQPQPVQLGQAQTPVRAPTQPLVAHASGSEDWSRRSSGNSSLDQAFDMVPARAGGDGHSTATGDTLDRNATVRRRTLSRASPPPSAWRPLAGQAERTRRRSSGNSPKPTLNSYAPNQQGVIDFSAATAAAAANASAAAASMVPTSTDDPGEAPLSFSERGMSTAQVSPALREKLDGVFLDFLGQVCGDLGATDPKGDHLHQTLMPKKMSKIESSPHFRPFKFRIAAFQNAFEAEVGERLDEECSTKQIKQYLWTQAYISRFNEEGKKAKSKGNHIWVIDARKTEGGGWEFRPFERKIIGIPTEKIAYAGFEWSAALMIWDPQAASKSIKAVFAVPERPGWLSFNHPNQLSGTPTASDAGGKVRIQAHYVALGQLHRLEVSFYLQVVPHPPSNQPPPDVEAQTVGSFSADSGAASSPSLETGPSQPASSHGSSAFQMPPEWHQEALHYSVIPTNEVPHVLNQIAFPFTPPVLNGAPPAGFFGALGGGGVNDSHSSGLQPSETSGSMADVGTAPPRAAFPLAQPASAPVTTSGMQELQPHEQLQASMRALLESQQQKAATFQLSLPQRGQSRLQNALQSEASASQGVRATEPVTLGLSGGGGGAGAGNGVGNKAPAAAADALTNGAHLTLSPAIAAGFDALAVEGGRMDGVDDHQARGRDQPQSAPPPPPPPSHTTAGQGGPSG